MSPDPILANYMQAGDGLGVYSPRNLWFYALTGNAVDQVGPPRG